MASSETALSFSRLGREIASPVIVDLMARALANSDLLSLAAGFTDNIALPRGLVGRFAAELTQGGLADEPPVAQPAVGSHSTVKLHSQGSAMSGAGSTASVSAKQKPSRGRCDILSPPESCAGPAGRPRVLCPCRYGHCALAPEHSRDQRFQALGGRFVRPSRSGCRCARPR